jgi:hypothetical protein
VSEVSLYSALRIRAERTIGVIVYALQKKSCTLRIAAAQKLNGKNDGILVHRSLRVKRGTRVRPDLTQTCQPYSFRKFAAVCRARLGRLPGASAFPDT